MGEALTIGQVMVADHDAAVAARAAAETKAVQVFLDWFSKGDLKSHPAADLFPMMADAQLEAMAEDIRQNGLKFPVQIDAQGRVWDGRNRVRALQRLGALALPVTRGVGGWLVQRDAPSVMFLLPATSGWNALVPEHLAKTHRNIPVGVGRGLTDDVNLPAVIVAAGSDFGLATPKKAAAVFAAEVQSLNVARRHLTDEQRQTFILGKAAAGQLLGKGGANNPQGLGGHTGKKAPEVVNPQSCGLTTEPAPQSEPAGEFLPPAPVTQPTLAAAMGVHVNTVQNDVAAIKPVLADPVLTAAVLDGRMPLAEAKAKVAKPKAAKPKPAPAKPAPVAPATDPSAVAAQIIALIDSYDGPASEIRDAIIAQRGILKTTFFLKG